FSKVVESKDAYVSLTMKRSRLYLADPSEYHLIFSGLFSYKGIDFDDPRQLHYEYPVDLESLLSLVKEVQSCLNCKTHMMLICGIIFEYLFCFQVNSSSCFFDESGNLFVVKSNPSSFAYSCVTSECKHTFPL